MSKRMIVMLAAVAAFVAALGTVKFRQIQAAIAQAASFQPPPEAVTTVVAKQRGVAGDACSAIGTRGGRAGRDRQRRPARHRRQHRLRLRPDGAGGRGAGAARHAAGAGAARRRRGAARPDPPQPRPHARTCAGEGIVSQADFDRARGRAQAGRGPGGRDPRHHRAQDDPRAVRGHPGHPPGEPRPVPERRRPGRAAAVAGSRST